MKKAVLFVHGLGGAASTWGNFKSFIEDDPNIEYEPFFYEYPSKALRMFPFFQKKYGNIQALSKGLKTYINHSLDKYAEIALVGHSLGGLIIRQYLLNQYIASINIKVKKVVFYAVPQEGSGLAKISSLISFNHRHLKQLCKNSEFLDVLNDQWGSTSIANDFSFKIVLAVEDKVVSPQSAKSNFRNEDIEEISNTNHRSIVKPNTIDDLSFKTLKIFLKNNISITKDKIIGSLTYDEWYSKDGKRGIFYPNTQRNEIILDLSSRMIKEKSAIRIVGLSGLGKTRLAVESFKKCTDDQKKSILYIDVATENNGLIQSANKWVSEEYTGILIVDNCPVSIHDHLVRIVKGSKSKLSLLTLDTDLKNSGDCECIKLSRLDDEMIKKMLSGDHSDSLPDIDRVVSFSQGFPQMAILIAKARINKDADVGSLTDDHIAHKLLWGDSQADTNDEKILRSCALFDHFGLEKDIKFEYKYIATNIAKIDTDTFYDCIKRFEERGLLSRKGRYIQLVPKPLAIRLAAQWWKRTENEQQEKLLKELPDSMIDSFCKQIEKLDFLPEVKEFTAELCGSNSPFGQAEVILSDKGSRFFRAFVNINPNATSAALFRIFTSLSREEIDNINITDAKLNIVWSLERLCFHAEIFNEAVWILLHLAMAENETWGNSATNIFTQLYQIQLSGTEACPDIKFALLNKAMELNNDITDTIILKALHTAITSYGGYASRMSGAENQGIKEPLKDWEPKYWQEIFDYWKEAISLLLEMLERGEKQKKEAMHIIGSSISHLIRFNQIDILNYTIKKVIDINGNYWPSALDNINNVCQHLRQNIHPVGIDALQEWKKLLKPNDSDLSGKLHFFVTNPPIKFIEKDGNYIDSTTDKAQDFASEVAKNINDFIVLLPLLLESEQAKGYVFGKQLAQDVDNYYPLIKKVLSFIKEVDHPHMSFCLGLFRGVYKKSEEDWLIYIENIKKDNDLVSYYPDFITTGEVKKIHLDNLLELTKNNVLLTSHSSILSYGGTADHLSPTILSEFCLTLSKIDNIGVLTALEILNMYCFYDNDNFIKTKETIRTIITRISFKDKKSTSRDISSWYGFSIKLLSIEGKVFAEDICHFLIKEADNGFDHSNLWDYLQPLLTKIIIKFNFLWRLFGDAIISSKGQKTYWLLQLIGKNHFNNEKHESVLNVAPIKEVIKWCHDNRDTKSFFIGNQINIFEIVNGVKKPTPLFVSLLENFGDDKKFGAELSANLGTGSWNGSRIPDLESDKLALELLLNHRNSKVRLWVNNEISSIGEQIKHESIKDEELKLGIY